MKARAKAGGRRNAQPAKQQAKPRARCQQLYPPDHDWRRQRRLGPDQRETIGIYRLHPDGRRYQHPLIKVRPEGVDLTLAILAEQMPEARYVALPVKELAEQQPVLWLAAVAKLDV